MGAGQRDEGTHPRRAVAHELEPYPCAEGVADDVRVLDLEVIEDGDDVPGHPVDRVGTEIPGLPLRP